MAEPAKPPDGSETDAAGLSSGLSAEDRTVVVPRGGPAPAPASGDRFVPGELLAGRFRIIRFLGQGGMGDVYEAEDEKVHGRVALKTLRPEIAKMPGALDRFTREIHLARKVTHSNICRLYDISQHGEVTFLAMEMLAGETLDQRLRREGAMSEEAALPLIRQMADGLAAAHRVGVVHRDFKPGNVMLVPEDGGARAVVTDFGLAHGAEPAGGGLTVRGDILGTPSYMAPEQVAGDEVTPATDIYSLGVTLYEMMTGTLPFVGETALSTAVKRLREDPPRPTVRAPHLARAWEKAILRCLAREPQKRFASVRDVVAALEPTAPASPAVPISTKPPWLRWKIVAAVLVVAAGAGVGAGLYRQHSREEERIPFALPAPLIPSARGEGTLPADPKVRDRYLEGIKRLARFDSMGAREELEKVVQLDPAYPQGHVALAETLQRLGYRSLAAEQAKRAAELSARLPREERLPLEAFSQQLNNQWSKAAESYRTLWTEHRRNLEYGLGLALSLRWSGKGQEALETVEAMHRLPPPLSGDARIDLEEAETAGPLGFYDRQEQAAVRAARKGEAGDAFLLAARAHYLLGEAHRRKGEPEKAQESYQRSLQLYMGELDLRGAADANSGLAVLHYDAGRVDKARDLWQEALANYRQVGDRSGEATLLNSLALVAYDQGKVAETHRSFEEALAVYREIGDRSGEAQALGNLGLLLGSQDPVKSARYMEQSLAIYKKLGMRPNEARWLYNLGSLHFSLLELGSAQQEYEDALRIAEEIDDKTITADALTGLGTLQGMRGDLRAALKLHQRAFHLYRDIQQPDLAAESRMRVADLLL